MRVKTILIGTAIVSALLGAVIAYLVLTVPNDIEAGALLRSARKEIAAGHNDRGRETLTRVVQQYPRTDAAAAAIAALVSLADREREVYVAITRAKGHLTILEDPHDTRPLTTLNPGLGTLFDGRPPRRISGWPDLTEHRFKP